MTELTWDDVNDLTDLLARNILKSNYLPTLIVAVARGGFIPARLLSSRIRVKRMASIGITYQGSERQTRLIYSMPKLMASDDHILLVEDALETGRSLADSCDVLSSKAASVRTVAYYYRSDSVIVPDFSIKALDQIPQFPWD
jgi:uncharacterized protein